MHPRHVARQAKLDNVFLFKIAIVFFFSFFLVRKTILEPYCAKKTKTRQAIQTSKPQGLKQGQSKINLNSFHLLDIASNPVVAGNAVKARLPSGQLLKQFM